jgi:signal transduction histidine kinase/CheY-like chemotaxis protein
MALVHPRSAHERPRPIHIRRLLIRELLALTGLAVALLLGLSWWALVHATDAQARSRAAAALDHLDREIRTRLEFAEHMGTSLALLWEKGVIDPRQDQSAGRVVLSLLSDQSLVSVIVLVDHEGSGLFADRTSGTWTTTTLRWADGKGVLQPSNWRRDGTVESVGPARPSPADFRERVWYRLAAGSAHGLWTQPYFFQRLNVSGITFSVPVRDANGTLLGALGIDLFLEELSQLVWRIQPTPHSIVTIGDDRGHAIVLPRLPEFEGAAARHAAYMKPMSETFLPVDFAINRASELAQGANDAGLRVDVGGQRYFALRRTFEGPRGIHWHLSLAIPEDDLLHEPRKTAYMALGLALVSLGILASRILHVANRFGTPLVSLARLSESLGRGEAVSVPPSEIAEVQELGNAIEVASRALAERRKLEHHLRHTQRLETLGTLAGGVAHDFNNILTTILGHSDILLARGDREESEQEALQEIRKAGERAARLTGQLLAFSRKQVAVTQPLDLNIIVSDSRSMLGRLIGENISLDVRLAPDLALVTADPGQLEQVLMNLVVNARDAMPDGGTLTIETRNTQLTPEDAQGATFVVPGSFVSLSVSDTGTGMDEATRKRIFEPFFTTKERGKGTGLGLTTVYGIVKQSGGYILVETEPGKGSSFVIYLSPSTGEMPPQPVAYPAPAPAGGTETILLVEDEAAVRALIQPALEMRGYTVFSAASGEQALRVLDGLSVPVQLLLTDVRMPGMSGPDLVAEVVARSHPAPRVLYMSGFATDLDPQGNLTAGTALIDKPFSLEALARKIRDVLDESVQPT